MKFLSPSVFVPTLFVMAALSGCLGGGDDKANQAPVAKLTVTDQGNGAWLLDGSQSSDPDGDALTYDWNWGYGNATTTENKHTVEFPPAVVSGDGSFFASLMVTDADGLIGVSQYQPITLGSGENRLPGIALADAVRVVKPNTEVVLDASASSDQDGDAISYEWLWGARDPTTENHTAVENACLESDATNPVFTTGCLKQGESFTLTFDKAGTYTFHCHPHPWMKARLIVDAGGEGPDNLTIDIVNYDYPEKEYRVAEGASVTFVNLDPTEHTATAEDYVPGTEPGGTDPVFRKTFPEGEYVVRLIVKDAMGGRRTQTWGIQVTADAPPNPQVARCTDQGPLVASAGDTAAGVNKRCFFNVTSPAFISATLEWADAGGVPVGNFTIWEAKPNGDPNSKVACPTTRGTGEDDNRTFMACEIDPGNYVYQVKADAGVIAEWQLVTSGLLYTKPAFGDAGATCTGHCH